MRNYQLSLINVDRLLKMQRVEEVLGKVFDPIPDRKTIIGWLDEGILEGKQIGRGDNYYIYESSLTRFITDMQPAGQIAGQIAA